MEVGQLVQVCRAAEPEPLVHYLALGRIVNKMPHGTYWCKSYIHVFEAGEEGSGATYEIRPVEIVHMACSEKSQVRVSYRDLKDAGVI